VALWWLILPDQAIPHHLTVALFWFRPLVWSRVGAPSPFLALALAAVRRPERTPDGQNTGLPSPLPILLVIIASGTLKLT
jgi:hypothetical protein